MFKIFVEEAAALASITLFVGMIAIWAQVIPQLWFRRFWCSGLAGPSASWPVPLGISRTTPPIGRSGVDS